jgi:multiple sugar transport system permease protein
MIIKSSKVDANSNGYSVKRRKRLRINLWCWTFMLPTLLLYVLFLGYPIITSIFYSTLDWSGMTSNAFFVGINNYKELMKDTLFINAVKNSFMYMMLCVPLLLCISLALAYIFNSVIKKGSTLFRTVFFLPVITTTSIIGIIMMFIFGGTGSVNQFLGLLGVRGVNWLGNAKTAMIVVVIVGVWKDVGTYMIYWIAALQSVSKDLYEAAEIDGASKWLTFSNIVFPIILPTGGIIAVLCVIGSLKIFDLIQTMTAGGPFFATDVAATFVYRTAYTSANGLPRLGYASAAAVTFGMVVVAIGIIGNLVKSMMNTKKSV